MAQTRIEPTLPSKTDTGTSTNTGNVGTTTQMLTTPASRMATDQSIFNSDSATEAAASMESSSPASAGVSPGSIAGITLGSVAFLIAVLLFLYVCVWRRLRAQHRFKAAGGLSRKPMGPMQEERRGIFAPNVEAWRSEIDGDAISRWADRRPERHPERSPQLVEADTPDASPRTPYTSGSRSALISNDDQGARPSWTTLDPRSNLTYVPFSPNQPPSVTHDTGRTLSTNNPPALHMENDEGCLTATGGPGRGRASYQSPEAAMRDGLRITGDGADDDGVRTDSKAHNDHQDAPATGSMP
ncbi:MAG: hypothetical protein M1817_004102 [Caeruleum heppii]|nr:MAG: hypothetical protein M1817_004102 [Caeruleum heppii]